MSHVYHSEHRTVSGQSLVLPISTRFETERTHDSNLTNVTIFRTIIYAYNYRRYERLNDNCKESTEIVPRTVVRCYRTIVATRGMIRRTINRYDRGSRKDDKHSRNDELILSFFLI